MKTKLSFYLMCLFLLQGGAYISAQVTIGSEYEPGKGALLDLKEEEDGSSKKGLLLPRVALVSLDDPSPLPEHVAGMYVYNTTISEDLVPGTYFNDGQKWNRVKDISTEPWLNSETNLGAEKAEENIYHMGTIAMGTTAADASAQAEIASTSKGLLIPRLTKEARNAIASPANGLLIYNTTSNCVNYYEGTVAQRWLSLCGTYDPAAMSLMNCDGSTGPQGTCTEGRALGTENTYTVVVNVSEAGTYDISARTTNGYAYSKSGVFTSTGTYTVVLAGQGAPIKEETDDITLTINNVTVTPTDCTLPPVVVSPASIRFTLDCSTTTVNGDYATKIPLNSSNYIEVQVNVTTAGETVIETASENGIKFSSGSITLPIGTQTVKLYGQGTSASPGTFSGNTFTVGSSTCTPTIEVQSSLGTFDFPANRCQDIQDEYSGAKDGYYWVQQASGAKFKTYCDMEPDGAWTLIKSLSERQILVVEQTQAESFASQKERNAVTTRDGKFNEYAFSLDHAVVQNIGSSTATSSGRKIRFTIKEKGATTDPNATYQDIENSTVSPNDDVWDQDNYWIATVYSGNIATGNFSSSASNNITEGKLFGYSWGKPSTANTYYYIDGVRFYAANPPALYSQANFFTGFYGAVGYVSNTNAAANNLTYTYHDRTDGHNGDTFIFNKYYINDLFGIYFYDEPQLNHHIGTCSNSTDDFGGASSCARYWNSWRPHRFNQRPDGTYEGRIVQYWVR